jgi:hypothetical protein
MYADPIVSCKLQEHPIKSEIALKSLRHGSKWRTSCRSQALETDIGVIFVGEFVEINHENSHHVGYGRLEEIFVREKTEVNE